jgi:hypothetical protein
MEINKTTDSTSGSFTKDFNNQQFKSRTKKHSIDGSVAALRAPQGPCYKIAMTKRTQISQQIKQQTISKEQQKKNQTV